MGTCISNILSPFSVPVSVADIVSLHFLLMVVALRRIDLDIESGDPTGYAAFVNQLREHAKGGSKPLYITAAPQCPFPDTYIGAALNNAPFDAVYVQFCTVFALFLLTRQC
jgi:Glycosyl hydrolases family 18